ncbi:RICIN domain-containing protein [Krasilnikovia sp. MM14-A1259]|uniref:RICIN domain-containing protein n=1 Tax=Krasilnikovia sp. MM14-A1259 TaxID=3373539 RepID=UPI0037F89A8B
MAAVLAAVPLAAFAGSSPAAASTDPPPVTGEWQIAFDLDLRSNAAKIRCVEVRDSSKSDNAPIQLATCRPNSPNQRWRFTHFIGIDNWEVININSGKCIQVKDNSRNPNAEIVQHTCAKSEFWDLNNDIHYKEGKLDYHQFLNRFTNGCMESNQSVGKPLHQRPCEVTNPNQRFAWRKPAA